MTQSTDLGHNRLSNVFYVNFSYAWRTTEWNECRVDALLSQQDRRRGNQTGLCGGGVQSREVYCVQANAELLSYINNNKDKQGTGFYLTV